MKNDLIFIDTETTGLDFENDEVLQISAVNTEGDVIFNEYIRPTKHTSWKQAEEINKISYDMVKDCKTIDEHEETLKDLFKGKTVVAYNMWFDGTFLKKYLTEAKSLQCCMIRFANYYNSGAKWIKLIDAVRYVQLKSNERFNFTNQHNAKYDTLACRYVWNFLDTQVHN